MDQTHKSIPKKDRPFVKEMGHPKEHDLFDTPEIHWPAGSVGHDMEDLWGSLHNDYNTLRIPIQCQHAFHLDVYELASRAKDHADFHRLMAQRSEARFLEVQNANRSLALIVPYSVNRLTDNQRDLFSRFQKSWSAADLAVFFADFEDADHRKEREEQEVIEDALLAEALTRAAAKKAEKMKKRASRRRLIAPELDSPTTAPAAPAGPPTPPSDSVPALDQPAIDSLMQLVEHTPPVPSPPMSVRSRNTTPSLLKSSPSRRSRPRAPSPKQNADATVKRNLRPRSRQTTDNPIERSLRPRPAGIQKQRGHGSRHNKPG